MSAFTQSFGMVKIWGYIKLNIDRINIIMQTVGLSEEVGFVIWRDKSVSFICSIHAGPEVHLSSSSVGVAILLQQSSCQGWTSPLSRTEFKNVWTYPSCHLPWCFTCAFIVLFVKCTV